MNEDNMQYRKLNAQQTGVIVFNCLLSMRIVEMDQVYYSPHEQHFQKEPKCTTNNTVDTPDTKPSLGDLNCDILALCVTH
jgi:hypothetical protein